MWGMPRENVITSAPTPLRTGDKCTLQVHSHQMISPRIGWFKHMVIDRRRTARVLSRSDDGEGSGF